MQTKTKDLVLRLKLHLFSEFSLKKAKQEKEIVNDYEITKVVLQEKSN